MKEYPNGQHVPRVLVVEDDKTQLRALGDVLEEEGFEVVGCATAREALDHLDRRQVDVAVVNLRPPDLSEGSLLEDLGAFSEDVPIIVHTRHSSYASVREAIRWVAFAYVEKSGAPDELVCHVHRAVQIHLAQRAEMLEAAVTEQKRAEQAVQRERDRAQMYLDIAGVMLVALDVEGRVTLMNRRGCEIVGLEQHQVLGRDWCDTFVPERDRRHVKEVFANLMAGEVEPVERSENPVLRADGAERLIAWHNRRLQDEEGRIIGTLSSGEDVTELRESHRRLEERLAELDHLYETSPLGLGVFDTNQRYTRVNSMLAAINGHPASEHIGRTPSEVIPELAPQIEPMLRRVIETGQADFDFELHGTTPAEPGMGKDWLGCYYPITSPGGKLLGVGIAVRDITNRKKAENELLAREERMRLAVQNVPVLVSAFDENGKLIVWNRECERVTGYTRDEMIGNPRALELLYPDPAHRECVLPILRNAEGDFRELEFALTCKDGSSRTVSWSNLSMAHPIPGWSTWAVGVDVTERKRSRLDLEKSKRALEEALDKLKQAQQQIIQQERLRALGQMASGVAHDLNNSLSPVLGYAELAASSPDLPDRVREWLEWVRTGARDAAAVVARLRQFYRSDDDVPQMAVELGDLLRQILELTRPKWRDEAQRTGRLIEVALMVQDGVWVLGNAAELRELLTNLVFNAVHAMPDGGRITLGLHATTELAVVEVTDTGIGMTDEVASRCFEPFFTARKSEGTGLGLSVCHGIATRHGGRIEIDTAPGCGTTVRVCLPINQESGSPAPEPIEDALPSQRVLYIDDDHRLRRLAGALFERLGHEADIAASGAQGLDKFWANDYDVVVTDLGMPGIDGWEVTRTMKAAKPHIPVIMVTGWGSSPTAERSEEDTPPDEIVAKPLTMTKLSRALGKVCGQESESQRR